MHHDYESDCTKFQLYGKTLHLDYQNVFRIWFNKNFVWPITAIGGVPLVFSKTNQGCSARWLDGVVIDLYFNCMFQHMFWILKSFHCQVVTIIYQQRALFTWNSMSFKYALCFTLDINSQTTFHHKRKSIRISLVKGLWSLFQFNLLSDPSPIIVYSCH